MTPILQMEADLKVAWDLVQTETNWLYRRDALRAYKDLLATYLNLKQKLFIADLNTFKQE